MIDMLLDLTTSPSGWWLVAIPILFLPLVYFLRRRRFGGLLATAVCLGLAVLAWSLPEGQFIPFLGQTSQFNALSAYVILLLSVATACLFFVSVNVSQGWSFYPFGLLILVCFFTAVTNQHLGLVALVLEIGVLLSVFIIQGGRVGSTRAALRFLVMMTLAVPLFLLAAWQFDRGSISLGNTVALLAGAGFSLWLGIAPLHGWVSSIASEAKSGIAAFIIIAFPSLAIVTLLQLLSQAPWLLDIPSLTDVMVTAGLFTAIVGGLFASTQRAFGPLMGYAALFDTGLSVTALGLGAAQGYSVVMVALLVRILALVLIAAATSAIENKTGGNQFQQMSGIAAQLPIPTIGLMVGGLTLAGAPFTVGFVARWLLLQSAVNVDAQWPLLILLGGIGVAVGYIRGLQAMVKPLSEEETAAVQIWPLNVLIGGLVVISLGLSLFPNFFLDMASALAQSLSL